MSEFFSRDSSGLRWAGWMESVYVLYDVGGTLGGLLLLATDRHSHKDVVTLIALVIMEARYPGSALFRSLIR